MCHILVKGFIWRAFENCLKLTFSIVSHPFKHLIFFFSSLPALCGLLKALIFYTVHEFIFSSSSQGQPHTHAFRLAHFLLSIK